MLLKSLWVTPRKIKSNETKKLIKRIRNEKIN
jgi:hypothetical protein